MMSNRTVKCISFSLAISLLLASCSSGTMIVSSPSNAKLSIDGDIVGLTPYFYSDTKIMGTTTTVRLEKEGYKPMYAEFSKNEAADVGAIIGGLFFTFPFLWSMKYKPTHSYQLQEAVVVNQTSEIDNHSTVHKSKVEALRELKQMLDEKIINQAEFDAEKKKILDRMD